MLPLAQVQKTPNKGFVYIADYISSSSLLHKMDHLACFAGAMLAVGAQVSRSITIGTLATSEPDATLRPDPDQKIPALDTMHRRDAGGALVHPSP